MRKKWESLIDKLRIIMFNPMAMISGMGWDELPSYHDGGVECNGRLEVDNITYFNLNTQVFIADISLPPLPQS